MTYRALPLDDAEDFQRIRAWAEAGVWGEARAAYVARVVSLVDVEASRPLKLVINSGNWPVGPTFDAIAARLDALGAPLEFVRVHHNPDHTFPNGIPNPLLPENHAATADVVLAEGADFGVAFDGDFDPCFFYDGARA